MLRIDRFNIAALPEIIFGTGRIVELAGITRRFGDRMLLVTGSQSFQSGVHWQPLTDALASQGIHWDHATIDGEPSPKIVDDIVGRFHHQKIDVVIGIGGGSAMDGAKAIAGLLPFGNSVMDHLEGVGRGIPYQGPALPMIAVPTTAGTGSEATKNAVLSESGKGGFKKSFRHSSLVPKMALLDPDLMQALPRPWVAAQAMDAFTQLIESMVSINANPFTDALVFSGIEAVRDGLFVAVEGEGNDVAKGRSALMYAALISGIALAQTGLGAVHGLASPLGAFFPIPHGVVCGTLLGAATRVNIEAMQHRDASNPALSRYADLGRMLTIDPVLDADKTKPLQYLTDALDHWVDRLAMPRLREYGVTKADFPRIVANSRSGSMKTNPLTLTNDEITMILADRM